ncbi:Hypothetical protein A7982_07589 [Minicystis rosea]|nr:Hypothetical protein A7982_07589 [Minicystis rosea]
MHFDVRLGHGRNLQRRTNRRPARAPGQRQDGHEAARDHDGATRRESPARPRDEDRRHPRASTASILAVERVELNAS